MYDPKIVSYIWRGFGSIDIVKDLAPGTDREEQELFREISETRAAIEKLVRDLPPIIEAALGRGFTTQRVIETIITDGQGLAPRWNVECLVAGVQAKLNAEQKQAQEAAEKAASEARKAAIQKQIDDAKASLRAMGVDLA